MTLYIGSHLEDRHRMNQLLVQYSYLQILDFLTTVAFLLNGVQEGNPLVRMAMLVSPHPVWGLVMVKVAAVCLGVFCWKQGRNQVLNRINLMFALVVAWNMTALIAGMVQDRGGV